MPNPNRATSDQFTMLQRIPAAPGSSRRLAIAGTYLLPRRMVTVDALPAYDNTQCALRCGMPAVVVARRTKPKTCRRWMMPHIRSRTCRAEPDRIDADRGVFQQSVLIAVV